MTRLGELPAGLEAGPSPAHYARPIGRKVLVTNDGGDWALLTAREYAAFARGKAPAALARRLAEAGFSRPPVVDRAAEALFPGSALSWRGPGRFVVFLERAGRAMSLELVEAVVDFAFSCGPDAPHVELVADDAGARWPAVWLAVQRALRRGEWSRRPARLELRARRLPSGEAARELRGWGVAARLCFELDGPPPGPEQAADAALALVGSAARAPEAWIDWLRARGFASYRLRPADGGGPEDGRAFAAFHAAALERLLEGVETSDLLDEVLVDYLRARPLARPGLDLLGELAVDADGRLYTSERALGLDDQGRAVFSLGDVHSTRFGDLASLPAARAALEASDADRQPLCCQCAYRPFCRTAPSAHYARSGSVWGRLPESADCAAAAAFLDRVFFLFSAEKLNILLNKANIDSL
jgi:radical SAM protein with 4Fe4S-binding SPASM domain